MPNSIGLIRYGDRAAVEMSMRFGGFVASTTVLAALPAKLLINGQAWLLPEGWYVYDTASTVGGVVCTATGFRFQPIGAVASTSTGVHKVRLCTAAALPANTRTGNTREASGGPGALGNIDGVAAVVGDRILDKDEAGTTEDRGIWIITDVGGATTWKMTRAPDFDSSAEITAGEIVAISEGVANGNSIAMLTTDDPIVVNTTGLTFTIQAALVAMTAASIGVVDGAGYFTAVNGETVLAEIGARRLQTRTATITHADLTDAVNGHAETENLGAVLPADARIVGCDVLLTTQFTGGGVAAVAVDVGIAGNTTALIATFDALGTAAGASYDRGAGAATRQRGMFGGDQMIATFTPDGAHHLEDLTAGELTVSIDFYEPGPA